jgi:hypothetical protein
VTLKLSPVEELTDIRGVQVSRDISFRQLVITGPPGSGKTSMVEQLHGWPEEGYLDLTLPNWWRSRLLTFRPREVHLGLPFRGLSESHAVFDPEWLEHPTPVETDRILLPPRKSGFFSANWRARYVFEFLIPPPEQIFRARTRRVQDGTHPGDWTLSLEQIQSQHRAFETVALYLHSNGLRVFVRTALGGPPQRIVDIGQIAQKV